MKMLKHEPRQCNWPIGFLAIRQEADGLAAGRVCMWPDQCTVGLDTKNHPEIT